MIISLRMPVPCHLGSPYFICYAWSRYPVTDSRAGHEDVNRQVGFIFRYRYGGVI